MSITNNHASFHFWRKENLGKHQNSQNNMNMIVSKNVLEKKNYFSLLRSIAKTKNSNTFHQNHMKNVGFN